MAVLDEINALKAALADLESKHAANPEPPPPPAAFTLPLRGNLSGLEKRELETAIRDLIARVENLESGHGTTAEQVTALHKPTATAETETPPTVG